MSLYFFLLILTVHTSSILHSLTHTVTTTSDSGAGSLRQAIIDANADSTPPRIIEFNIATGIQTITPATALPFITASNVLIDGSTQPGFSANDPQIVISGASSATAFDGLVIDGANNCTIQDLVINGGFNIGISIKNNNSGNAVYGCFLGTDQAGTAASGNNIGIFIESTGSNTTNNFILGAALHGNVCSGNDLPGDFAGIGALLSGNITNITIQGNFIGTDKTGTVSVANRQVGMAMITAPPGSTTVLIDGGLIGGTNAGEGNLFSGNSTGLGFILGFQNIQNITFQGNFVGTDITGTTTIPNGLGILSVSAVDTSMNNITIGGTVAGARNIIAGNPGGNIGLQSNANNCTIQGNFIGTDITGTTALGLNGDGISILGNNNVIGGSTAAARNIIHSDLSSGIRLQPGSSNNTITNNYVGINVTGSAALSIANNGIEISGYDFGTETLQPSNNNSITNNVIGNCSSSGIFIQGGCTSTIIQGNTIGMDAAGTTSMPNNNNGIEIQGFDYTAHTIISSNGTIIGGSLLSQRNLIGNNNQSGIYIAPGCSNSEIYNNYIGVDATGTASMPNGNTGIQIQGYDYGSQTVANSNGTVIGGSLLLQRNIISNNNQSGIYIGLGCNDTEIYNNYVGFDVTGTVAFGNNNNAIQIDGYDGGNHITVESNNTIIGAPGKGNLLGHSNQTGIYLGLGVNNTTIQTNYIGVDSTGTTAATNNNCGIQLNGYDYGNTTVIGCNNTTIGGTSSTMRNIISGSTNSGIQIGTGCDDTTIQGNYIGVDSTGLVAIPNGQQGINISGFDFNPPYNSAPSNNTIIGGSATGAGNVISGNISNAIYMNSDVNDTIIQGNLIGVGSDGSTRIDNGQHNIFIQSNNDLAFCLNTIIGGPTAAHGNTIAASTNGNGIFLQNQINNTLIQNNYIGTNSSFDTSLGNFNHGIEINGNPTQSCTDTTILNNVIGRNGIDGIFLNNHILNTTIQANYIGTDTTGTINLGNLDDGIQISGAFGTPCLNNMIGGTATGNGNSIAFNGSYGIQISGDSGDPDILNSILGNRIYSNTNNGIVLFNNSNNNQATATIDSAEVCASDDIVIVSITAPAAPALSLFRIEIFGNTTDTNPVTEGKIFIGAIESLATSASTTVAFPTTDVVVGDWISVTATNLNNTGGTPGDSSEFSLNTLIATSTPPSGVLVADSTAFCLNNSTMLTLTITGSGPYTVAWSDGVTQTNVSSPVVRTVSPTTTTTYSATITSVYGCEGVSNSEMITVYPLPTISLTLDSITPETAVVTATPAIDGPFTLTWFDGLIQPGVTGPVTRTLSITHETIITVEATNSNGCSQETSLELQLGRFSEITRLILIKYS